MPSDQCLTERKLKNHNEQFHTLLNSLKKLLFVYTIIGMAGNASVIIMIIVLDLSFFVVFVYTGYLYCLFKNETNYVKE